MSLNTNQCDPRNEVRENVYAAIDTECHYLHRPCGDGQVNCLGDRQRSMGEFAVRITSAGALLKTAIVESRSHVDKLNIVRNIAALCVCCMEQHGAPQRHENIAA